MLEYCFLINFVKRDDGELALQSAIQKTQKLSPQILSFKLLYCIFFFFVITRLLYLTVKQLSFPDLSSI